LALLFKRLWIGRLSIERRAQILKLPGENSAKGYLQVLMRLPAEGSTTNHPREGPSLEKIANNFRWGSALSSLHRGKFWRARQDETGHSYVIVLPINL
jgi:hypothetical protein